MASSLSPAAPAYFPIPPPPPPLIPPPPPPTPGLPTYVWGPATPLGFFPAPYMGPRPPMPLPWASPPLSYVPVGMHGAFPGSVVPHGAMAATPPWPAPGAPRPRQHLGKSPRMRRAAGPVAPVTSGPFCGVKAAGDATREPSPRSVLVPVATSPPISPTTSLPSSFPYQLGLPTAPPATESVASATSPPRTEESVAARPPQRRGRARPASGAEVRRRVPKPRRAEVRRSVPKPRRLFDPNAMWTSLMIRNIPNDFTRARLMNVLDQHCSIENEKVAPGGVRSEYDFLYLPIDFRTLANKGYAFVNMTSPDAARRLWEDLHDHRWSFKGSGKTCAVDYAYLEGLDEHVMHFSGSHFDCHTEEFLPVHFEPPRDGARPAVCALRVVGRLVRR